MEKGFLILLETFLIVGIIDIVSMKAMKISESKKTQSRKFFWYCYGIIFMLNGGVNLDEKVGFDWIFSFWFPGGLISIILNFIGNGFSKH